MPRCYRNPSFVWRRRIAQLPRHPAPESRRTADGPGWGSSIQPPDAPWGFPTDRRDGMFGGLLLNNLAPGRAEAEMRALARWVAIVLLLLTPVGPSVRAGEPKVDDDPETFFELKVRPVLAG